MKRAVLFGIIVTSALLAPESAAGAINIAWDPVPGASGYNVYYGTSPNNYTNVVDVGNNTSTTLNGINDCVDYYVSAKAYNSSGESAQFSNQVSGWGKPQLNVAATLSATQGDQFTLNINGANFKPGASLLIDGSSIPQDLTGASLVRIENPAILNCNSAQALITIEPNGAGARAMEVGSFPLDLEIVNPSGIRGQRGANLVVNYDSTRTDLNQSDTETTNRVDGKDLAWLAFAHGAAEGDPRWNADADLNGDGFVDGQDLALLATSFGQCWNGTGWSGNACP